MLFVSQQINNKDIEEVSNLINIFDNNVENSNNEVYEELEQPETAVSQYIKSLVSFQYEKSVEDIENTNINSHRSKRKRTLQQVMRESFFHGANRFGTNFIA